MAASFCTQCGGPLDAQGICQRCQTVALPVTNEPSELSGTPYETTSNAYGAGSASTPPPYTPPPPPYTTASGAAPVYAAPQVTRFSGMWNWGAFLLCPFWLLNHGALGLGIGYIIVSFIPFIGIVALGMAIYFGIKGNDWAVQHRTFSSEDQFVAVQNAWRNWGIVIALIGIVLGIIGAILVGILGALTGVHHHY